MTGANRGMGFEVCRQLADESFEVILTARDAARGQAAADLLGVAFRQLDVSDAASITSARDWLQNGRYVLDVLVNNAAINYDTRHDVLTADIYLVGATLRTNTLGPWRMTLAFLPLLRRSAHPRVVNVSSEIRVVEQTDGRHAGQQPVEAGAQRPDAPAGGPAARRPASSSTPCARGVIRAWTVWGRGACRES